MRAPRFLGRRSRVPVVELRRSKPVRAGIVLIVIVAIAVYFGFSKKIPFSHGYRFSAVFSSAQNIAPRSPVRIAGVTVGSVTSIKREGKAGLVTMEVSEGALPIHRDAELKIRPRLFLEGNWFVELKPGTPSSPELPSGGTIGIAQTAIPVQIDQVLDALNEPTRSNLQAFLDGYGEALSHVPSEAEDAEQEPEARGLTGGEALKETERYGPQALRGGAITSQALGGVEEHDISHLIAGLRHFTGGLNQHEQALGEWVGSFDHFLEELANRSASLEAAVDQLPGALRSGRNAFAALKAASPSIKAFSNAFAPGVEQTHATIAAAFPWIDQLEKLLGKEELAGVATSLQQATPSLAGLISGQKGFFAQTEAFSKCLTEVFYPAGRVRLADGKASTGAQDYREFFYTLAGLDGIGQNFDGNGIFPRFLAGGNGHTLVSEPASIVGVPKSEENRLIGNTALLPEGTSPAFPKEEPPYEPLVPCYKQKAPDLNGPLAHGPVEGSGK